VNNNNELEYRIDELFKKKESKEIDMILDCINIILNSNYSNDITRLYNLIDLKSFVKIITLFDGKNISIPKKSDFREVIILALCYYYKEIKQMNWNDIKKQFTFEISPIKYGLRIKSINKYLKKQLDIVFKEN